METTSCLRKNIKIKLTKKKLVGLAKKDDGKKQNLEEERETVLLDKEKYIEKEGTAEKQKKTEEIQRMETICFFEWRKQHWSKQEKLEKGKNTDTEVTQKKNNEGDTKECHKESTKSLEKRKEDEIVANRKEIQKRNTKDDKNNTLKNFKKDNTSTPSSGAKSFNQYLKDFEAESIQRRKEIKKTGTTYKTNKTAL